MSPSLQLAVSIPADLPGQTPAQFPGLLEFFHVQAQLPEVVLSYFYQRKLTLFCVLYLGQSEKQFAK